MLPLRSICKPQYFFRPRWVLRKLLRNLVPAVAQTTVRLPWGAKLEVDTRDTVGHAIASQGVYDIVTSEVLWRVTDLTDRTMDVGANIGYFTSLLAHRVGHAGQVLAFEPHPETYSILQRNVALQERRGSCISAFNVALSNAEGEAILDMLPGDSSNTSHAFLNSQPSSTSIAVRTSRGERYVDRYKDVGVLKIDAQWHEAAILEGFGGYLSSRKIRDIVFEEEAPFPAHSHSVLLDAGYSILWFEEHFRGPKIIAPSSKPRNLRPYDLLPSYLATLDPKRAEQRLSASGWQCFCPSL